MVSNSDDDDFVALRDVNYFVFELTNAEFSHPLGQRRTNFWVLRDESDGGFHLAFKAITEPHALPIEVGNRLFKFRFRWFQKASLCHCLRDRSLANTCSAGTALISPRLYAAYLCSASSAHSASLSSSESSSRLSRRRLASSARAVSGSSSASAATSSRCLPMANRFYQIKPAADELREHRLRQQQLQILRRDLPQDAVLLADDRL